MPSFAFGLRRKMTPTPPASSSSAQPPVVCRVVAGPAAEVVPCYGYAFGDPGCPGDDQSFAAGASAQDEFDEDSLGHRDFCEETSLCGGTRVIEVEGVDEDWAFYEKLEGRGGMRGGEEVVRRLVLALEDAEKDLDGPKQYSSLYDVLGMDEEESGELGELWGNEMNMVETEIGYDSCVIGGFEEEKKKVEPVAVGFWNSPTAKSGWEADGKENYATTTIVPTFSRQANTTATPVRGLVLSKLVTQSPPLPAPKPLKIVPPVLPITSHALHQTSQPLHRSLANSPHSSLSDSAALVRAPSFAVKAQPLPPPSLVRRGRVRPRPAARATTFGSTLSPAHTDLSPTRPDLHTSAPGDILVSRSADLTRYIASEDDFFNSHMPSESGIYFGDDFPPSKGGLPKTYSSCGRINFAALRRLTSGISAAENQRCKVDKDDIEEMRDAMPPLRSSGLFKVKGLLGRVKGWGQGKK